MANPPPSNKSAPKPLRLSIPADTYAYLTLLAGMGKLGTREPEIALHLIVREVTKMQESKFHERQY
jgi:hypothetical protein